MVEESTTGLEFTASLTELTAADGRNPSSLAASAVADASAVVFLAGATTTAVRGARLWMGDAYAVFQPAMDDPDRPMTGLVLPVSHVPLVTALWLTRLVGRLPVRPATRGVEISDFGALPEIVAEQGLAGAATVIRENHGTSVRTGVLAAVHADGCSGSCLTPATRHVSTSPLSALDVLAMLIDAVGASQ